VIGNNEKRDHVIWGSLRLILGFAQMSLVALTFGILITTGLSKLTILLAGGATALTLASRLLYHGRRGPGASHD
jgi:hypothetical protein